MVRMIMKQFFLKKYSYFFRFFWKKGCRILNIYLISLFFSKVTYTYVPSFLKHLDKTEEDCRSYTNSPDSHFFLTDPVYITQITISTGLFRTQCKSSLTSIR